MTTLRKTAEKLRRHGQRGDTVLAHISPAEAKFLQSRFGGDINPKTGLPQYGLFKAAKKVYKSVAKVVSPITSKSFRTNAVPLALAFLGNSIAGPIGAQAGSAVGTAMVGGKRKDYLKNAAITYGVQHLAGNGGGSGLFGGNGAKETSTGGSKGILDSLNGLIGGGGGGGGAGLKGLLGPALLATTVMGGLKGKSSYKPYEGPTVPQMMAQHGVSKYPVVPVQRARPPRNKQVSLAHLQPFNPGMVEQQYFQPEGEFEEYAQGGVVRNAYMRGGDGGQADTVDIEMPEGSYVQDATTISLYGDGGSEAGNLRLDELKNKFIKAALDHGYQPGHERMMPAKVSHEEAIWPPEAVYGAGLLIEGDPKKGVKVLDRFRDNLRKQKGLKKFLPPKSKSANYYLE